jgi:guanylate kinase
MAHWREFDHVIINDDVQQAVSSLHEILAGRATDTETGNPALRKNIEALLAQE